jgi:hypothetical protein
MLELYSEFQRIDPFGRIVPPDQGAQPREINSPAVARNSHASFHLAVTLPENASAHLYIQQNPEIFEPTVYRELFVETPRGWIPDALQLVKLPHLMTLPDAGGPPGQTTQVFWIDLWIPPETPVQRVRVEAVIAVGDRWLQHPLEVRVMQATVGKHAWSERAVPPVTERIDSAAMGPLAGFLKNIPEARVAQPGITVRQLIRRDVLQDLTLANPSDKPAIEKLMQEAPSRGPEWYLRVRDMLYRR